MIFVRNSCILIPESFKGEEWYSKIIQDLTRQSRSYEDPSVININRYYDNRNGCLMIPRYYPIENLGHKALSYVQDGENITATFKSSFRNDLQRAGYDMLINNSHGILQLPPGEGKTVISIGAICRIGKKAIIFVHKDSLISQWKERFLQHSDITEDRIGELETSKCAEIMKKDIVITTVQTFWSMIKNIPNIEELLYDANFGVAIWDECHTTTGAELYGRSSLYLPCKRVFGLSATPGRSDQNHDIIWLHLGSVYRPDGETATMAAKVVMIYFDHGVMSSEKTKRYVYWGYPDADGNTKLKFPMFDTSRYLRSLTFKTNNKYIPYMQQICKQVNQKGREVLFISDRIKVLDLCSKFVNKNDVGFFIPRSGEKRDSELQKKFVFSTPGSSRDGTDKPSWNCLIMANAIGNIEQASGRITRFMINKPKPIIMDIVDSTCDELVKRAEKRKEFYQSKNWEIEEKRLQ